MTHELVFERDSLWSRLAGRDDISNDSEYGGFTQRLFDDSRPKLQPASNPALTQLEKLPQTAVLKNGMVLYDLARESLQGRSAITNEPVNKDAILQECNRIMVLNGYEDARLDGKSGITGADLPKSWNHVSWGQEFKLYGDGDFAKISLQSIKESGEKYVPSFEIENEETTAKEANPEETSIAVVGEGSHTDTDEPVDRAPLPEQMPPATGPFTGNPEDFFICQFRDKRFNPNGPSSSNDCGPTSLSMIALYHDAQFTVNDGNGLRHVDSSDADRAKLVSDVRFLMTGGRDSQELTGLGQIDKAAKSMGFETSYVTTLDELDGVLDQGKMVVLSGNPKDYQKDFGLRYGIGGTIYDGGHFVTVVARQGDSYIVNDPANHGGTLTLSRQQLDTYMRPNDKGLAVYA